MQKGVIFNEDYRQWFAEIGAQIRTSQVKAAVRVNSELLDRKSVV